MLTAAQLPEMKRRFDELRGAEDAAKLKGLRILIQEFRAAGHDPNDPSDKMYEALGINQHFLKLIMDQLAGRAP